MTLWSRRSSAEERTPALSGFKVAHPLVSGDGRRIAFHGVTLGGRHVYGMTADAVCAQQVRHRPPSSRCDCGFYCFHAREDATAMAGDPQHRGAVTLDVLASGRFLRYERGLRYERQTVRAVRVGVCGCGRTAAALADDGPGAQGWRGLVAVCRVCAGERPVLALERYATLAGDVPVHAEPGTDEHSSPFAPLPPAELGGDPGGGLDEAALVPLLHAEVALLQGRLDHLQARLAQLDDPPG